MHGSDEGSAGTGAVRSSFRGPPPTPTPAPEPHTDEDPAPQGSGLVDPTVYAAQLEAEGAGSDASELIEDILSALLPGNEETVSWVDAGGNTWVTPLRITIRQQRYLLSLMKKLWAQANAEAGEGEEEQTGMAVIVDLLLEDAGIDQLLEIFDKIHHASLRQARDKLQLPEASVEDLVSLEDLIGGVLPFCVKPLLHIVQTIKPGLTVMEANSRQTAKRKLAVLERLRARRG